MHHLTCGISSLLHSVNLIVFTVLLAHLILHISPHHSHHLRSHHLLLPRPFTPDHSCSARAKRTLFLTKSARTLLCECTLRFSRFLANCTNGRAIGTVLCLSVVCL